MGFGWVFCMPIQEIRLHRAFTFHLDRATTRQRIAVRIQNVIHLFRHLKTNLKQKNDSFAPSPKFLISNPAHSP